jgi:hypothetical protein
MRTFVLLSSLSLLLLGTSPARADVAPWPLPAGSGPQIDGAPGKVDTVAMHKEHVVVTLHNTPAGAFAVVDATFWMRRVAAGPPTLKLAFPGQGVSSGDGRVHPKLVGFRAFVAGLPVAVDEKDTVSRTEVGPPGRTYTRERHETWHRFALTMPADKSDVVVRVRYAVAAERWSTVEGVSPHAHVAYILHTGALWAGVIDEAVVEIRGVGVDLSRVHLRDQRLPQPSFVSLGSTPPPPVRPAGLVTAADRLLLTLQALEPANSDDLDVIFPATAETTADLEATMQAANR